MSREPDTLPRKRLLVSGEESRMEARLTKISSKLGQPVFAFGLL